jgi:hypothetical protein
MRLARAKTRRHVCSHRSCPALAMDCLHFFTPSFRLGAGSAPHHTRPCCTTTHRPAVPTHADTADVQAGQTLTPIMLVMQHMSKGNTIMQLEWIKAPCSPLFRHGRDGRLHGFPTFKRSESHDWFDSGVHSKVMRLSVHRLRHSSRDSLSQLARNRRLWVFYTQKSKPPQTLKRTNSSGVDAHISYRPHTSDSQDGVRRKSVFP